MFAYILLIINFIFLLLAFILIIYDLLTLKTSEKEKTGERSLPKLSSRALGFSLLAFLLLVFISFVYV